MSATTAGPDMRERVVDALITLTEVGFGSYGVELKIRRGRP